MASGSASPVAIACWNGEMVELAFALDCCDREAIGVGAQNVHAELGGAYTGQGMTMSTNGIPWGIAVPGMGRSLYAGLTVKF